MSINSILTPEDIAKTEAAKPGWYPAEIVNYSEETTKGSDAKPSDGSTNAIFEFKILDGDASVKGRTFKRYFNEKVLFFGKNLWAVVIPGFNSKTGGNVNSDAMKASVGKKLKVYVTKDKKTGYDTIEDYQPLAQ